MDKKGRAKMCFIAKNFKFGSCLTECSDVNPNTWISLDECGFYFNLHCTEKSLQWMGIGDSIK